MLSRYWYWGMVVAVSGALAAGCHSPSSRTTPSSHAEGWTASGPGQGSDSSTRKLAEAHAHYAMGVVHEVNDEPDAALEEYYQAATADAGDEALVLEVSRRLLQKKQPEKALELLVRASALPNASGAIYARLGLVYSQLGKNEQAIAADRAAIKRTPDALAGYQNLFFNLLQLKQEAEALKLLDEAAKQPAADAEFFLGLSELCQNLALQAPSMKDKADARALAALNHAEKLDPADPALRLKLADGFAALGANDQAAELYLELLKKLPDVPFVRERVHARLADIYLRGSDHKRASEQLEAVVREDPTNPQAYFFLGSLAFEDKRLAEAADYFSKSILLNPDFEPAYRELAYAQIDLNKTSEALETLDKARKRFPQSFRLEYLTGLAFSRQKGWAEALRHYTAAEVIAQGSEPRALDELFYFQFGAACERSGDLAQAEKYFQKCLQLKPDFDEALNYLGYMWAEHDMKLEQAHELIEKAVKAEPKNAAYLDSLGWVLFKLKQPKEALDYILKAVELSESPDPTVFDHLGDIYAALQQPDKARESWRKSLALEANEDVRKKLESEGGH